MCSFSLGPINKSSESWPNTKQARSALIKQVPRNQMATLTELQTSSAEKGDPARWTTISEILQSGLCRVTGQNPLWNKKVYGTHLQDAEHRGFTDLVRQIWLNSHYIWQKTGTAQLYKTIPVVKHGGGITTWTLFPLAGPERLVWIEGRRNVAKKNPSAFEIKVVHATWLQKDQSSLATWC